MAPSLPITTTIFLLCLRIVCPAQNPGQLDSSFGGVGYVITNGSISLEHAQSVLLRPDGLIIASGTAIQQGNDVGVARFLPDGQLDPDFGTVGSTTVNVDLTEFAFGSALQPDGHTVIAGMTHVDTTYKALLVRLDANGLPDLTLNGTGTCVLYFPGEQAWFFDVAIQPDGKIVACGNVGGDLLLHRLLPNGTADPDFGTQGTVRAQYNGASTQAQALSIQPNGQIVVAGSAIARFNADGGQDVSGFGTLGWAQLPADLSTAVFYDLLVQPDDHLVACGYTTPFPDSMLVVRLLPDGTPDMGFAMDGSVKMTLLDGATALALALQPDGMIVTAGSVYDQGDQSMLLTRIQLNGQLDFGFGQNGTVVLSLPQPPGAQEIGTGIAIQDDGAIVAVAAHYSSTSGFLVARFHGSGSPTSLLDRGSTRPGNVFPVPAQDMVNVECRICGEMPVTMDLYDPTGRQQRSWAFSLAPSNVPAILDLQDLASGSYVLVLRCGQFSGAQKLIVE